MNKGSESPLREHINKRGGRLTKQRQIIIDYLRNVTSHPAAETIYKEIKKKMPNISLGTIYRNLNYLVEEGLILQLSSGGRSRFDGNNVYHLHFICENCGDIEDIFDTSYIALSKLKRLGKINSVECNIYGRCKECEGDLKRMKHEQVRS